MSIADEIQDLNTNLTAAKAAVTAKGGTVGDTGLAGLAEEIASIPSGGGGEMTEWGSIKYYSVWTSEWDFSTDGVDISDVDKAKFDAFVNEYHSDYPSFAYQDWGQTGNSKWVYSYDDGELEISRDDFTSMTGISYVSSSEPMQYGYINVSLQHTIDTSSAIVSLDLEESNLAVLANTDSNQIVDLSGTSVLIAAITELSVGSEWTTIPNGLCGGWQNLRKINYLTESNITTIGNDVLKSCPLFDCPIILPDSVETIGTNFLNGNAAFNSPVVFNDGLKTIGYDALHGLDSFNQPVIVPNSVTSIGQQFLAVNKVFNSSVCLSNSMTSIPISFLSGDSNFNQPIALPNGITTIADGFLSGCSSFNQSVILPGTVTTIGADFLGRCTSFNQELIIPEGVTSIGYTFLQQDTAFNKKLVMPSSLRSIGNNFLGGCNSFNSELVLPSGLQTIGGSFLIQNYAFNQNLTIPNTVTSIGGNSFQSLRNMQGVIDLTGVPIDGISAQFNGAFCFGRSELETVGYVNGIKIKCDDQNAFSTKFPNGPQGKQKNYYRHVEFVN